MAQKFATKFEKRARDDEKRRESLNRKLKERLGQKMLVKHALSATSTSTTKKIKFNDDISVESENKDNLNSDLSFQTGESQFKKPLFDELDGADSQNVEFDIKHQFEGKKGYKLLHLQSNYNNDERFKLDERFHDDEGEVDETYHEYIKNEDAQEDLGDKGMYSVMDDELLKEKKNEMKILESVLGSSIQRTEKTIGKKRSFMEMVRFDASNEDHKRRSDASDLKEGFVVGNKKLKLIKKEKLKEKSEECANKANQNLNDKFYQVSDDLRAALKDRKKEETQFSLLAAFSRGDVSQDEELSECRVREEEEEEWQERNLYEEHDNWEETKDYEYNSADKKEEFGMFSKVAGIVNEKFFFTNGDIRLEEGQQFMNMKGSDEAKQAFDNYDSVRAEIREILRLRLQKYRQKKNPFKKKIGGSNRQNSIRGGHTDYRKRPGQFKFSRKR